PNMTIAHRGLDEMHVEATGCRDRHQRIAARDAHRDGLENLAGIDAERPRLSDRCVGLLVRDGLERDAVRFEMLCYLPHHPTPNLAREPMPYSPAPRVTLTSRDNRNHKSSQEFTTQTARQRSETRQKTVYAGGDIPEMAGPVSRSRKLRGR